MKSWLIANDYDVAGDDDDCDYEYEHVVSLAFNQSL